MKIVGLLLIMLALTGCLEEMKEEAYEEGYSAGLEDQRAHICNVIADEQRALNVLQDKQICY